MKYKECEYCGAALDFGEKCDCLEESEIKRKRINALLNQESNGQISIVNITNLNSEGDIS